jgi:integrase
MGVMDRAWFLLMLHSALRTGEVRRMRAPDLDTSSPLSAGLEGRRVRVEQSKGLKDRVVCLSPMAVARVIKRIEVAMTQDGGSQRWCPILLPCVA